MSSGFVSSGVTDFSDSKPTTSTSGAPPSEDRWAKAEEAVKLAQWQQNEKASSSGAGDEKSLYEILQANKARKQEEIEEKLKFKNQFKPLDEDDVEYLDSIMDEQARIDHLRKQELAAQLDVFRKAQYEAEMSGNSEALEGGIPKVEDIVVGGWGTSGRKRKKNTGAGVGSGGGGGGSGGGGGGIVGTKFRKMGTGKVSTMAKVDAKVAAEGDVGVAQTSTATPKETATGTAPAPAGEEKLHHQQQKQQGAVPSPTGHKTQSSPDAAKPNAASIPQPHPASPTAKKAEEKKKIPTTSGGGLLLGGGLGGLVSYSSDEDDD